MAIDTEHHSVISKPTFKITIGLFFALAIVSVIARLIYRFHARRSLYLDDYVVLFGALCLCAAIGIIFHIPELVFLGDVLQSDPSLIVKATPDQIKLLGTPFALQHAFFGLTFTTVFAVKFSFLIFFKKLITRVTKIHTYYWFVGGFTLVSWLFLVLEPLVLCAEPSKSVATCPKRVPRRIQNVFPWVVNGLDLITDIMIVSIPLIILRRAKIKKRQKLGLSFFLCLSIAMIVIAVIRMSRIASSHGLDLVWQILWQALEPSVALLMASITAFRSIFVSQEIQQRERERKHQQWATPAQSWIQRAKNRKKLRDEEDGLWRTKDDDDRRHRTRQNQLPSIPQATFVKMKRYFQGHGTVNTQSHSHGIGMKMSSMTGGSTTLDLRDDRGVSEESERERARERDRDSRDDDTSVTSMKSSSRLENQHQHQHRDSESESA